MNLSLKINKSILFYILVLVIWMLPSRLVNLFSPYETYFEYICQGAVGLYFILKHGAANIKSGFKVFFLIYLVSYLPGAFFVNGTDAVTMIRFVAWLTSLWGMISFYSFADEYERESFFRAVRIVFVAYLVLSYIYAFLDTEVNILYFVGSRAVTVQSFIACFALCLFHDIKKLGRITSFSYITGFFALLFAIWRQSGQGMMMITTLALLVIINQVSKQRFVMQFRPWLVLVVIAVVNYMLITLAYLDIDIFVDFVTAVLGKDATLTGRSEIFTLTLEIFAEHPIIGYGYDNTVVADTLTPVAYAYNTAHNSMLQMLVDCGVLGTALFGTMIYFGLRDIYLYGENGKSVLYFGIIAMFVGGLVNMVIPTNFFWMVLLYAVTGSDSADEPRYRIKFGK